MKKYIDDFAKMTADKMSQAITDMTYLFEKTIVPKEHYKKLLNKELIEVMSNDKNIEMNLLKPYYDMLNEMISENPKFFFKALVLIASKTKFSNLSTLNIEALDFCWETYSSDPKNDWFNSSLIELFKDVSKHGVQDEIEVIEDEKKLLN